MPLRVRRDILQSTFSGGCSAGLCYLKANTDTFTRLLVTCLLLLQRYLTGAKWDRSGVSTETNNYQATEKALSPNGSYPMHIRGCCRISNFVLFVTMYTNLFTFIRNFMSGDERKHLSCIPAYPNPCPNKISEGNCRFIDKPLGSKTNKAAVTQAITLRLLIFVVDHALCNS